jgi:hypothetical protein
MQGEKLARENFKKNRSLNSTTRQKQSIISLCRLFKAGLPYHGSMPEMQNLPAYAGPVFT